MSTNERPLTHCSVSLSALAWLGTVKRLGKAFIAQGLKYRVLTHEAIFQGLNLRKSQAPLTRVY